MSKVDLDELERLAKAATPGPWHTNSGKARAGFKPEWHRVEYVAGGLNKGAHFVVADVDGPEGNDPADAAYIAAANPSTVLALLEELRLARAVVESVRPVQKRMPGRGHLKYCGLRELPSTPCDCEWGIAESALAAYDAHVTRGAKCEVIHKAFVERRCLTETEREEAAKAVTREEGKLTAWPQGFEQSNACTDPCDMWDGPCACGAWHKDGR